MKEEFYLLKKDIKELHTRSPKKSILIFSTLGTIIFLLITNPIIIAAIVFIVFFGFIVIFPIILGIVTLLRFLEDRNDPKSNYNLEQENERRAFELASKHGFGHHDSFYKDQCNLN